MDVTLLVGRLTGPVMLLRGLSILIDREHCVQMVEGNRIQLWEPKAGF